MAEELPPRLKWEQLLAATQKTLYMTALSGVVTFILGIALGLALSLTAHDGLFPNHAVYSAISSMVNILRSIPFIILIVLLIPFTKAMVGTILGANAALPVLTVGAVSSYVCLAEIALREVDKGVIEATRSMGAQLSTLIFRVLLPGSSPILVSGIAVTLVTLANYSTITGAIGAGGLGNLAYLERLQRSHGDVTLVATVTILPIVFIVRLCGGVITSLLDKR